MEISALRLATTAQGVMQVMGASRPEMIASAPDGVEATLIVSVVPRDTDAHPPSTARAAITPKTRIHLLPNPVVPNRNLSEAARGYRAIGVRVWQK